MSPDVSRTNHGKIGTSGQSRDPFAVQRKKAADQPGPGGYLNDTSTFKNKGNAGFGSKYKSQTTLTPGPGQYDTGAKVKGVAAANAKIGTSKRPDLWNKAKEDAPGPADFGENYSSFKNGKGANMGGKYKEKISDTPGPGQYQSGKGSMRGSFQGTFSQQKKK